jgi:hypothetical protein
MERMRFAGEVDASSSSCKYNAIDLAISLTKL